MVITAHASSEAQSTQFTLLPCLWWVPDERRVARNAVEQAPAPHHRCRLSLIVISLGLGVAGSPSLPAASSLTPADAGVATPAETTLRPFADRFSDHGLQVLGKVRV